MIKKLIISALILLAFGLIRWPLEKGFTAELKSKDLMEPALNATTREKLGQTGAAVALGGLRSMVASMWNLRAHVAFTDQRWFDLENAYGVTTTLQPRNPYYWDSGSWHLAYNASADYKTRYDDPPALRRINERDYIKKGIAFLEDGIRINPDNMYLKGRMATILTDRYKQDFNDFARAASYLKEITESDIVNDLWERKYLYALARVPEKKAEAYALARDLYIKDDKNRLPTLLALIWVYQNALEIPAEDRLSLVQLFGDKQTAFAILDNYYGRREEGLPTSGLPATLRQLSRELGQEAKSLEEA